MQLGNKKPLVTVDGLEALKGLVGREIGPTDWRSVTQEDIDDFARLSGDDQWIHVDVDRATRESPYGVPIAHGNMTLSMFDGFRMELWRTTDFELGINYGWNKVRFPAPVPVGARLRARTVIVSVDDMGKGWWQVVQKATIELEGSEKPACTAERVGWVRPPAGRLNQASTAESAVTGPRSSVHLR
jgi:acyl dehydratase